VSFEPDEASIEKTKAIVTHLEKRLLSAAPYLKMT